jgi:hypothetical protein
VLGEAAYVLGNASHVPAQGTVPFTLRVAAHHLGDVDTSAAIAGGIVASPPEQWRREREPLPDWVSRSDQEL